MANDLEKLQGFLSTPSAHVNNAIVDIVRRLTGSDKGLHSLAACAAIVFPRLVRRLYGTPETAAAAAEALVNLSQDAYLATKLVSHGSVATAINVLYKSPDHPALVRGLVLLLTNLTQVESGVAALLQIGNDKVEGLNVAKLVRSFCRSSSTGSADDTFELVASILVNISKVEAGRKILLDPRRALLKQVIHQFDSTNPLRKKGVAGTIRNCCFEADNQLQNLLSISEYLWPALLLPVAGNKIYNEEDRSKMPPELANALSHEREIVDDPEIRQQALEATYLIYSQEAGRRALLSVNGLRILQVGYKDEEDPKVMKAYEQITSLVGTQSDPVNVKGLKFNGREWTITIKASRYGTLHCGPFNDVNEAQSVRDVLIYKLGIRKHAGMVHEPEELVNMDVWKYCKNMNLDDLVKLLKNKEFYAGYKSYVRKGKSLQEGRKLSSLEKKAPSFVQDVGVLGVQRPFSPSPGERGTTSVGRAIGKSFSTLPGNKGTLFVGRTLESSFSRLHGEKEAISRAKELENSFSPILRKKGAGSARKDETTVDDGDKENTPSVLEGRTLLLRERKVANKEFTPVTENGEGNANAEDIFLLKTLMIKLQQQVETAETALSAAKGFSNEVLKILANY